MRGEADTLRPDVCLLLPFGVSESVGGEGPLQAEGKQTSARSISCIFLVSLRLQMYEYMLFK